jgi:hypothetical protein
VVVVHRAARGTCRRWRRSDGGVVQRHKRVAVGSDEPTRAQMKKPFFWSLASGFVWIGVASVIAYIVSPVSPIHTTPFDAARPFAGGIVAAPVIGLLVGHIARRFSSLSRPQRIWVALADLYLATYLFLLAAGIGDVVRGLVARSHVETVQRLLVVDPLLGTLLGLTYTGFVVVLFPLSYFNHVLIGKAWDQTSG